MLNSIKRLEINSVFRYDEGILARNAVWILTFYTNLRQAILAVLITFKDSKWLSEYVKIFGGLSKIKDLAIRLDFLFDSKNRSTWWGLPSEVKQSWKCGSRRSKAVHDLLSVTSGELNSLELWTSRSVDRPGDDTKVYEKLTNAGEQDGQQEKSSDLRLKDEWVWNREILKKAKLIKEGIIGLKLLERGEIRKWLFDSGHTAFSE